MRPVGNGLRHDLCFSRKFCRAYGRLQKEYLLNLWSPDSLARTA
jgi:hypothetical protein